MGSLSVEVFSWSNYCGYKPDAKIHLIPESVDFRRSVTGLTIILQEVLEMNLMERACFVFF